MSEVQASTSTAAVSAEASASTAQSGGPLSTIVGEVHALEQKVESIIHPSHSTSEAAPSSTEPVAAVVGVAASTVGEPVSSAVDTTPPSAVLAAAPVESAVSTTVSSAQAVVREGNVAAAGVGAPSASGTVSPAPIVADVADIAGNVPVRDPAHDVLGRIVTLLRAKFKGLSSELNALLDEAESLI